MPARDDAQPRVVPWTEELACRAVRVLPGSERGVKLRAFRKAAQSGGLGDEAIAVLVRAGYTELKAFQRQ